VRGTFRIIDVQPSSTGDTVTFPDGRVMADIDIVTDDEGLEMLRQGYVCRFCFEEQEVAMPEHCGLCGYQMRHDQPAWYARTYRKDTVHIGSRINPADEIERMGEHAAYEARTGIVLPDHVKFPNAGAI
jgi:hypothetical protein